MLTRNYYMAMAAHLANKLDRVVGSSSIKPKFISVSGSVGGDLYSSNYSYSSASYMPFYNYTFDSYLKNVRTFDVSEEYVNNSSNQLFNGYGTFFGSGNTAPTIDDYKLSGSVIQNITYSYVLNDSFNEDGSAGEASATYTITNNNESEITIGEVGLFCEASWIVTYNKYTHFFFMLERTALETPITIPAGGVGQVTYTIRMNYPVG